MEEDIIQYLQTLKFGTVGTNIFKGILPDKPDKCICVKLYDSGISDLAWNGEYPIFQVAVRAKTYDEADSTAQAIYKALHGICEQTINSKRYLLIQAIRVPMYLSDDAFTRKIFTTNFSVIKEI